MNNIYNYYNRPMQTIGKTTLISDFIKHLLANTWVPIIKPVTIGDFILENNLYIYQHQWIRCTKSGLIGVEEKSPLFPSNTLYPNDALYPSNGIPAAKYDIIDRFNFGTYYNNLTSLHQSRYDYYDEETHRQLGRYLKCINKIYGINYMPFYNCFCNTNLPNIEQYYSGKYLYITPIEFNTKYTISYKLDNAATIQPILYAEFPVDMNYQPDSVKEAWKNVSSATTMNGRHYDNYIYIEYSNDNVRLQKLEKYLYLLISTSEPIQSLAVIEGHFNNTNKITVGSIDERNKQTDTLDVGTFDLFSELKLLSADDNDRKAHYAFSNRLVEGLLHHTINSQDEIQYDIGRVQAKLNMPVNNIWHNKIKSTAFSQYMSTLGQTNENVYFDISGNIDKEIEYYLFGNNIST